MAPASLLLLFSWFLTSSAQSTLPVPPLQWINLTNLLSGSVKPPPLKDAAIGYDETSRSIIIFGGESVNGIPQSATYLLNLNTLTWSSPSPPSTLTQTPPARSSVVAGCDFAASNRHAFVVVGGKGGNGPLDDVWEFDFTNQFWSSVNLSPGGPTPRWGAAGGIDLRVASVPDPVVEGPNNTLYLAGGFDGSTLSPLNDVWQLSLAGVLSSNLPDKAVGSWKKFTSGSKSISSGTDMAGTVVMQDVVAAGGCNTTSSTSCGQTNAYVLNSQTTISIASCSAPKTGPVLVPNLNSASDSFSSQVFLLLGTFNQAEWDDQNGLSQGEVAVLDVNQGTWSRVLPSGDPGSSGKVSFPSPREGAAAVSYQLSLVGGSRTTSSDTIIFGGRDSSGNYLSDMWLLRAYDSTITSSGQKWSGFGNGQLQTGTNASGAGVTINYLTQCAIHQDTASSSGTTPSASTSTTMSPKPTTSGVTSPPANALSYDTSVHHKLFAPLSLTLLLPAVLLHRISSPPNTEWSMAVLFLAAIVALAAYGLGIVGLVTSFTSIKEVSPLSEAFVLAKRSTNARLILKTTHGRAALAFFVGLYGVIPLLYLLSYCIFRRSDHSPSEGGNEKSTVGRQRSRSTSIETAEKLRSAGVTNGAAKSTPNLDHGLSSRPGSPRQRTHSWGPSSLWRFNHDVGRISSDSESAGSSAPNRGFEVVNRHRRTSEGPFLAIPAQEVPHRTNLRDIDWLQRRRSLNAVGELDYAITQSQRANQIPTPETPATSTALMAGTRLPFSSQSPYFPHAFEVLVHFLFHAFLFGLCIITLVALWSHAPRTLFAIFLVWTVAFYVILFLLAWHGRPTKSILSAMVARLKTDISQSDRIHRHFGADEQDSCHGQGPYTHHQPPYRAVPTRTPDALSSTHEGPRSVEADDEDDDEDEDTRQRRIEEEMERRDVSIVTVPKRRLWVANPS